MPSIITHGMAGAAGALFFYGKNGKWKKLIIPASICAALPDADAICFKLGVAYGSLAGHRGITHSLFIAILTGLLAASIFSGRKNLFGRKWFGLAAFFTAVTASHGLLDAFTSGGMGVAILAPIDNTRLFAPWTPIKVSPISIKAFFGEWGARVLKNEIIWVWLPALGIVFVKNLMSGLFNRKMSEKVIFR